MTPEEQKAFDQYVGFRRSLYPWWQFWVVVVTGVVCITPVTVVALMVMFR